MNSDNFMRWMKEKIVPNLPPRSIVVMDNAPYHRTQINKTPTMGNTKKDLKDWLKKNNIEFDDSWKKPQLYDLITRHKMDPQYKVDLLLNEHGHEVLRLPPYHCDLNPIEQIWAIVKRRIAEKNVSQMPSEIASITETAFSTITPEEWSNVCMHVQKIEEKYFKSDRLLDNEMDKFVIDFHGDTTESSDQNSSVDEDQHASITGVNPLRDHNYSKFNV